MTDDDRIQREPSRQAPSAFLRGRAPQAERVGTHRGHDAWTAYRHMRWAWWTLTAAFVASLLFDASVELRLGLFVFWGALGGAAAHWPCPHCGGRVGVAGKFFRAAGALRRLVPVLPPATVRTTRIARRLSARIGCGILRAPPRTPPA